MAELHLKNPHSILAALRKRPQEVKFLQLPKSPVKGAWELVQHLAVKHKIPTVQNKESSLPQNKKKHWEKSERVSGLGATVTEVQPIDLSSIIAHGRSLESGFWIAVDCIQDPHNLGAIFRTAAFFGAQGILLSQDRTSPMSATVYDVACGGVEEVPFCFISNLSRDLKKAQDAGFWIIGTAEESKDLLNNYQLDRRWIAVLGNEEKGMRRLTRDTCDVVCAIPSKGAEVKSLNVSVAAGIVIAHFLSK